MAEPVFHFRKSPPFRPPVSAARSEETAGAVITILTRAYAFCENPAQLKSGIPTVRMAWTDPLPDARDASRSTP